MRKKYETTKKCQKDLKYLWNESESSISVNAKLTTTTIGFFYCSIGTHDESEFTKSENQYLNTVDKLKNSPIWKLMETNHPKLKDSYTPVLRLSLLLVVC
jgi:hypothetical protein